MTVFTPLTDKDYEGLRRTLRSLQVNNRFIVAAATHVQRTVNSDGARSFHLPGLPGVKHYSKKETVSPVVIVLLYTGKS